MSKPLHIVFSTDWHVRTKFSHPEADDEYGDVGYRVLAESIDWVVNRAVDADIFVHGGDIVDSAKTCTFEAYGLVHSAISQISSALGPDNVHIILGNHDIGSGGEDDHALIGLNDIARTYLWPEFIKFGKHKVLMVPWCEPAALERFEQRADIAFAHIGLHDHKVGNGQPFGPFTRGDFNADKIFAGHYHKPATYGDFIYTGALTPMDFRDEGIFDCGLTHIFIDPDGTVTWEIENNPYARFFIRVAPRTLPGARRLIESGLDLRLHLEAPLGQLEAVADGFDYKHFIIKQSATDTDVNIVCDDETEDAWRDGLRFENVIRDYVGEHPQADMLIDVGTALVGNKVMQGSRGLWELERIKAEGFLSIGNADIEIKPGITAIVGVNRDDGGSNGAGKSSVVDAVFWTLYGNLIRDSKLTAKHVPNRATGKADVSVFWKHRDAIYEINRLRNNNNNAKGGTLKKDGRTVWSNRSDHTVSAQVTDLMGVSDTAFLTSVLFSKRSRFLSTATPGNRASDFMALIDLGLDEPLDIAKQRRKDANDALTALERDRARWEGQHVATVAALKDRVKRCEESIAQGRLGVLQERLSEAEAKLSERRAVLLSIVVEGDLSDLQERKVKVDDHIDRLRDAKSKYLAEIKQIERVCNKRVAVLSTAEGSCPVCERELTEEQREEHMFQARTEALEAKAKIERGLAKAKTLETTLNVQRSKLRTAINDHLSSKREQAAAQEAVDMYSQLVDDLKRDVSEAQEAEKIAHEVLARAQADLVAAVSEIWERDSECAEQQTLAEVYAFWVKGFGKTGIANYLLSRYVTYVNDRASVYVNTLASDIDVSVASLSTGIDVTVKRAGVESAYGNLSDGQKAVVDLALQLAFHDLVRVSVGGFDFVVFDEAIAHLDTLRANAVIDLLKQKLSGTISKVLFITHRNDVALHADQVIEVELADGVSAYSQRTI